MVLSIGVKQPTDHPLVLRVVLSRLILKELNAAFAQGDRNFYAFVPENQVFRARKEIRNDLEVSEGFVGVADSLAHRFAFLCANSQLRRYG